VKQDEARRAGEYFDHSTDSGSAHACGAGSGEEAKTSTKQYCYSRTSQQEWDVDEEERQKHQHMDQAPPLPRNGVQPKLVVAASCPSPSPSPSLRFVAAGSRSSLQSKCRRSPSIALKDKRKGRKALLVKLFAKGMSSGGGMERAVLVGD
jgi:hypothetical protein